VISGSIGSVGWMPVRSVSGSFGLGVANVKATPRCNKNIQYILSSLKNNIINLSIKVAIDLRQK
jgi:hypothetical protein